LVVQEANHIAAGGIPGVAGSVEEFHAFLDSLEVEIKQFGYQPKLNFVYGRKAGELHLT
jgi:hypothetical protein